MYKEKHHMSIIQQRESIYCTLSLHKPPYNTILLQCGSCYTVPDKYGCDLQLQRKIVRCMANHTLIIPNANGEMTKQNLQPSFPAIMFEKWQAHNVLTRYCIMQQQQQPIQGELIQPNLSTTEAIHTQDPTRTMRQYTFFSFLSDYLISSNKWRSCCPHRKSH